MAISILKHTNIIIFFWFKSMLCNQYQDQRSTTSKTQNTASTSTNQIEVANATLPFAVAALATVAPILPLGVSGIRDDSTESDQSLTYSHNPPDVLQRFM